MTQAIIYPRFGDLADSKWLPERKSVRERERSGMFSHLHRKFTTIHSIPQRPNKKEEWKKRIRKLTNRTRVRRLNDDYLIIIVIICEFHLLIIFINNRCVFLSLSLFSEHVWEVQVHRRGLAVEKNIVGTYHLCLTDKALRLSQTGSKTTQNGEQRMPYVEFLLTTIRR